MNGGDRRRRKDLPYWGCRGRLREEDVARLRLRRLPYDRPAEDLEREDFEPGRGVLMRVEREPVVDDAPDVRTHWVEIVMLGEDDHPVPGLRYEIELPDGKIRRGRLDREGTARVDGIRTGGRCQVRFPELDEEAWRPL